MSANGKSYKNAIAKVDRTKRYLLEDGLSLAKETARAKFDETVEMAVRLGVDPRQADQNVRGTVSLAPWHGKDRTHCRLRQRRQRKRSAGCRGGLRRQR